jgi:hypothetical protein
MAFSLLFGDLQFSFNVSQNLSLESNSNTQRTQVHKRFADAFTQCENRERAIPAIQAETAAEGNATTNVDSDSERGLFKQGMASFERYAKWME